MVLWSKQSIRDVAAEVLASEDGQTIVRTHLEALLVDEANKELNAEVRSTVGALVEDTRPKLQRQLSALFSLQAERMKSRLAELERELEASSPALRRKLETFERKMNEVSASSDIQVVNLKRTIEVILAENIALFSQELDNARMRYERRSKTVMKQLEDRLTGIVEDRLHDLMVEVVREHVRSSSFADDGLTNRQRAAAEGISLREVKRRRRAEGVT